ncbi:SAM-dependent methyltransferase, partial [Mesorhizobium sp.]
MTRLKARIVELIGAAGPIPVNQYMALCLFDPRDGYYTTREPFGAAGDFVTAPEISQMFGELVAVWLYEAWLANGRPMPVTIAEIGPGRGTLMKDMLRTFSRLDPALTAGASFAMIETSP